MSKDAVISGLFLLPLDEQHQILNLLKEKLEDDIEFDSDQMRELDRRFDLIEKEGFKGKPWDEVYSELLKARNNVRRPS